MLEIDDDFGAIEASLVDGKVTLLIDTLGTVCAIGVKDAFGTFELIAFFAIDGTALRR